MQSIKSLAALCLIYTRLEQLAAIRGDLDSYRQWTNAADQIVLQGTAINSEAFWETYQTLAKQQLKEAK